MSKQFAKGNKKAPGNNPMKTLKRMISYIFRDYKFLFFIVLITLFISSIVSVVANLFLKTLIDDYIVPLLGHNNPSFKALLTALAIMAAIFYTGVISTYIYSRLMVNISQEKLKNIRDDLFEHMEKLPIKYFDTHAHGDIMSIYTNDTDTLRQMISQSIPQLISSIITIVGTFVSMIVLSPILTILIVLMVFVMYQVMRILGSKSAFFFGNQQRDIGKVNGYIEEMMEGQKVVKVFSYEEDSKKKFNELNDSLFNSADNANSFANMLMPIMNNIGNISYVLIVAIGAVLAISGVGNLTLGALASFLQLTRSFRS